MKPHLASWQLALTIVASITLAGTLAGTVQANDLSPDDVFGPWATHEGGEVTFYDCGEYLCGDITDLRPPDADTPTTDIHNPDEALRDRPLLGLQMFSGLEEDSDGKWSGGKLYNTMEGKEYKAKLQLEDDGTMTMSGCVMFFCKSFVWTKIESDGAPDNGPDNDNDAETIDEASNE